ncbi:RIKEN cDNA 4632404H12 [Mus musculus]|uniref:Uncharacterized protein n=1 Tax=Mus musculus TaxID=10090 RepID=Q9D683_MOUSE|nr:RIKEN cDNA 4632404H12 [Mus musculus]BAB29426.1 unnamed protein product [Mus musculus]
MLAESFTRPSLTPSHPWICPSFSWIHLSNPFMRFAAWCDSYKPRSDEEKGRIKAGEGAQLPDLFSSAGIPSPGSCSVSAEKASGISELCGSWTPMSRDALPLRHCPTSAVQFLGFRAPVDTLPLSRNL